MDTKETKGEWRGIEDTYVVDPYDPTADCAKWTISGQCDYDMDGSMIVEKCT